MQFRMYTYWGILWIFSIIFNVCRASPLPQIVPYACGQGLRYANGQCISNVTIVTQPCTTTNPCCSCQITSTQICQTTQPCQTTQVCQTAQPCQTTQPTQIGQSCAVQQCQTSQGCQPCTITQPCQATQTCQTAVTQPCPITVTEPCPKPPPIICPCPPPPPPTTATPPTTTPPIPPPITTTTQGPPGPIIECPLGTIRIFNYCHLIYCGSGIYRDGKCIITVCPEGTIWTGSRCKHPEPQNQTSLYISNVINTNVDHTSDNHVINYINNLVINVTDSPIVIPPSPSPPPVEPSPIPLSPSSTPSNCCYIVTPQTCFWEGDQYQCASRKYRRCGSICTAPYIYLKPPIAMPPPTQTCQHQQCEPFYPDCNACDNMTGYSCQTYCQPTICQKTRCQSINLMGYCRSYPGAIGCRRADGCLNDWCY